MVPKDRFDYDLKQIDEEIFLQKINFEPAEENPIMLDAITDWDAILGNTPSQINKQNELPVQPVAEQNPIKIILDKQRKTQKLTILSDFELEIPTDKVIDLLEVMFDRDEVIDEIIKSATAKNNFELINRKLEETIKYKIESLFSKKENDDYEDEMQINRQPLC
jgi:hypothetical protein